MKSHRPAGDQQPFDYGEIELRTDAVVEFQLPTGVALCLESLCLFTGGVQSCFGLPKVHEGSVER